MIRTDFPSRDEFYMARPFPHVVVDCACDATALRAALTEWPSADAGWRQYQKGKRGFCDAEIASPAVASLIVSGNAPRFVEALRRLTGIDDLVADDGLEGGGLHETERDGLLRMHVDFNRLGLLYRRVNVLLFLNEDWRPEWGGDLLLTDDVKSPSVTVTIPPAFNRLVIFESSEHSWHGHPTPLKCPVGRSRKSVAWYYYSASPHPSYNEDHSTKYIK